MPFGEDVSRLSTQFPRLNRDQEVFDQLQKNRKLSPGVGDYEVGASFLQVQSRNPQWSMAGGDRNTLLTGSFVSQAGSAAKKREKSPVPGRYNSEKCYDVISRPYAKKFVHL